MEALCWKDVTLYLDKDSGDPLLKGFFCEDSQNNPKKEGAQ